MFSAGAGVFFAGAGVFFAGAGGEKPGVCTALTCRQVVSNFFTALRQAVQKQFIDGLSKDLLHLVRYLHTVDLSISKAVQIVHTMCYIYLSSIFFIINDNTWCAWFVILPDSLLHLFC